MAPRAAINQPGSRGFRWARGEHGGRDKLRLCFAKSNWRVLRLQRAMARFSEFRKMFGFKPTCLSKTLGRGKFGMEPTACWEMAAKCVMRG
jgi:hypothetical protein